MKTNISTTNSLSNYINDFKLEKRISSLVAFCLALVVSNSILQKNFMNEYYEYIKLINVIVVIIELIMVWQLVELIISTFISDSILKFFLRIVNLFTTNKNFDLPNELLHDTVAFQTQTLSIIDEETILTEQEQITQIAINYSSNIFANYISEDDLESLKSNIYIYGNNGNFDGLKPVKIPGSVFTNLDLYHFGWNIWYYLKNNGLLKNRYQVELVSFLKIVFPEILESIKLKDSIRKNLTNEENKGRIKITKNILDYIQSPV